MRPASISAILPVAENPYIKVSHDGTTNGGFSPLGAPISVHMLSAESAYIESLKAVNLQQKSLGPALLRHIFRHSFL